MGAFFVLFKVGVKLFFLNVFVISGLSMAPFFSNGDVMLITHSFEEIHRGDIVVFSFEDKPDYFYVKRVIGVPFDRVKIAFDGVYVDSGDGFVLLDEKKYLGQFVSSVPLVEGYNPNYARIYNVPDGKYFVLGDNREGSVDSRYFDKTFVSVKNIYGVFVLKLFNIDDL